MADTVTDTTNAIVPLIGLGIVAGMAGRMIDGRRERPRRTRTITRTRTVYKTRPKKTKGVTVVKTTKYREPSFFNW